MVDSPSAPVARGRIPRSPVSSVRLFGIPATQAPVVAVIRRGPSAWCQVLAWYPDDKRVEVGAWLRGKIFPQRSDVSPCGKWLSTLIYKAGGRSDFQGGDCWENVSRLPWLKAYHVGGTTAYSRGRRFLSGGKRPRLAPRAPVQFAVERERGWAETANTPPREHGGSWDEERRVVMVKVRPGGGRHRLFVRGAFAAFREFEREASQVRYSVNPGGDLDGVQWADWDRHGNLLVATWDGELQIRAGDKLDAVEVHASLAGTRPDPQPPPDWAVPRRHRVGAHSNQGG